MKKLLLFFITILSISFTFSFRSNAVLESVEFNVNVYDNYKYDLITGDRSYDVGWASTNRLLINPKGENTIYLNSNTFHHVLFWDTSNKYMGYANSPLYADYDAPTNLGIPITDQFILPTNTKYIAFLNNTGEFPIEDLNGHTLKEVFETINIDISSLEGWSLSPNLTETIDDERLKLVVDTYTPGNMFISKNTIVPINLNYYYWRYDIQVSNTNSLSFGVRHGYNDIQSYTNNYIGSDSNIIIASDTVPLRLSFYGWTWVVNDTVWLDNFYLVDMTTLGIDDLTVEEMDAYYTQYEDFISNWFNVLNASALETIQPTYQRDFTPIVDEPIGTDIDTYLESINANTPFAKAILSVALIVIAVLALALIFKTPKIVYLMVASALYLLFTILGWLPAWLLIIIAMIILLIMFISFKSSGGGNSD